jgi:hypothetical protein
VRLAAAPSQQSRLRPGQSKSQSGTGCVSVPSS